MATYKEIAPIIEGTGITKTQVENYFSQIPEKPEPQPTPTITKAKIQSVANAFYIDGVESSGGIKGIASAAGLQTSQVKEIIRELQVLKAAYDSRNQE